MDPSKKELIHAVYPSVDTKITYVLYHPDKKSEVLYLLHNLKNTISTVFSPNDVNHYFKTDDITISGYPRIDATTQSYVKLS